MNSHFNNTHYSKLLDSLEAVEISFSQLNNELRYEAEFFQKKYLKEAAAIYNHQIFEIGSFASVTDGPHGYHVVDHDSPIAMLTAKCARNWFAEREGAETIAEFIDRANKRSSLDENDIILSTRGTVGMCALVTKESLPANIDQDVARISWKNKKLFRPEFILTYLNSRFGQDHIARYASGMVQQGLSLQKVRDIPIPGLNLHFQNLITEIVQEALSLRRVAQKYLQKSETILLEGAGLNKWVPADPLSYVCNSKEVFTANRLDSEHFKPKYSELLTRMSDNGCTIRLGDLLAINQRGKQPVYSEYGIPVVNSKHINASDVALDKNNRTAIRSNESLVMKVGDVLINGTGVGTIGRAAPYLHNIEALPDNHVTVLRPYENSIDPIYLSVFLNSKLGQLQVEKRLRGSSGQIELYPNDLAEFSIWVAPDNLQKQVHLTVRESFLAKWRASELMELAKLAVEIGVESGEELGIDFLKQNRMDGS